MRALVTGFDPFGGDKVNPSSLAVSRLKKKIGKVTVVTAVLPTSYARSAKVLREAIDEAKPDIVLCVGQAGGRTDLCVERVGINVQDARIPDNDRKQPIDVPVRADGLNSDIHGSAEYRAHLVGVMARRAVDKANK